MKENDKNIEKLIDKVMKGYTLQTPSFDFTAKVMGQVNVQKMKAIHYQPLISKTGWMTIFGSIFAICIYVFLDTTQQVNQYTVDLSFFYDNKLSEVLAKIHFSEVTMYAVIVLTFLILIQIPLLNNHFGRKHIA